MFVAHSLYIFSSSLFCTIQSTLPPSSHLTEVVQAPKRRSTLALPLLLLPERHRSLPLSQGHCNRAIAPSIPHDRSRRSLLSPSPSPSSQAFEPPTAFGQVGASSSEKSSQEPFSHGHRIAFGRPPRRRSPRHRAPAPLRPSYRRPRVALVAPLADVAPSAQRPPASRSLLISYHRPPSRRDPPRSPPI